MHFSGYERKDLKQSKQLCINIVIFLRDCANYRMIRQPKLMEILSVVPLLPSGMNAQTLRFRPVPSEQAQLIHPLVRLGAALPEEHLPPPRPRRGFPEILSQGRQPLRPETLPGGPAGLSATGRT